MHSSNKKIVVVCFANYCRSPVAEYLLKNKYKNYEISSAGIRPLAMSTMDKRSVSFLNEQGFASVIHNPKRINQTLIKDSDIIYALDVPVLMQLNNEFPSFKAKFKLLNHQNPKVNLSDPYQYSDDDYRLIMMNIKIVCESLEIN